MKKIILSLAMIAAMAALAVGATTAYFSDTETSEGNTFTAGAIDLKVGNHCYYNGDECKCDTQGNCTWQSGPNNGENCACTWELTDLTNELFANFSDLKPGDWGEDTISLQVNNNKAWVCADVKITTDSDVTCTEPEKESTGDTSCQSNTVDDGELDKYLEVFAWADICQRQGGHYPGDNIYTPDCDRPLMNEPTKIRDYEDKFPIADATYSIAGNDLSNNPLPLIGKGKYYIGKAWCFGEMNVDTSTGEITCDGKDVENDAQTDTLQLEVSFEAMQYRNNSDFTCVNK
jgi:predicted ribosomally synthesized peptide with SipW-like signal peptide